jgi:hypothetical protein
VSHLLDLQTPWCAYVAATMKIPDHLDAGTTRIAALAEATGSDERALHGLLSHLVQNGVFEEPEPGTFAMNEAARELQQPFLDLHGIGGRMAHAWSTLETYVKTGRSAYDTLFGRPWWDDLAANPELGAEFDELMGIAGHGTPDVDFGIDWTGIETVVDVGGGTGALLNELLEHRDVQATLVDLPGTVARAQGPFEKVGQSFFDPLPHADLYILKSILNDWPDAETDAILANVARAQTRAVVIGGVAPDDAPRRLDIEMVLLGGRTDTLAGFRERAARAGLAVIAAGPQPAGNFVVECKRS